MRHSDRFTEIENNNRRLLQNIKQIGKRAITRHSKSVAPNKKTLNYSYRQKTYDKISKENLSFLNRLKNQISSYNVNEWGIQEKKRMQILKHICEFPYQLPKSSNSKKRGSNSFILDKNETQYLGHTHNGSMLAKVPSTKSILITMAEIISWILF